MCYGSGTDALLHGEAVFHYNKIDSENAIFAIRSMFMHLLTSGARPAD